MVFFNYSTQQMAAKVVYYGPGLGGKTSNLQYIYDHTSKNSRGEMVSLDTDTDRTLFFDLLPIDVGTIGGFETRIQLYTVPGQVFYNATRKLVLKGVDGVVFVADSQRPMLDANRESFDNLVENLRIVGLEPDDVPIVLQYNKRDLPGVLSVDELDEALNRGDWPTFEASALSGKGIFETLTAISKLTLKALRTRVGQSVSQRSPAPRHVAATSRLASPAPSAAGAPPAAPQMPAPPRADANPAVTTPTSTNAPSTAATAPPASPRENAPTTGASLAEVTGHGTETVSDELLGEAGDLLQDATRAPLTDPDLLELDGKHSIGLPLEAEGPAPSDENRAGRVSETAAGRPQDDAAPTGNDASTLASPTENPTEVPVTLSAASQDADPQAEAATVQRILENSLPHDGTPAPTMNGTSPQGNNGSVNGFHPTARENGHVEMSRQLEMTLPRKSLMKARRMSMLLQFEDEDENIVGNMERSFDLTARPADLEELLLQLNVTVNPND